jgi:hypothetical protein
MKWGEPSPHHENLARATYASWIFKTKNDGKLTTPPAVRLMDHVKRGVDSLLTPMPAARAAARVAYRTLRAGMSIVDRPGRARSNGTTAGLEDELGRNPRTYRDHGRVRAFDHCHYQYAPQCGQCDAKAICDGFHGDYAEMFGVSEAQPMSVGRPIDDPTYFIKEQEKLYEPEEANRPWPWVKARTSAA